MKRFPPFHDHYPRELVQFVDAKQWASFFAIQQEAIRHLPIDPSTPLPDAILEAETSSGKTEAAFLPLLARLHRERNGRARRRGFDVLYISPLRALINDQEGRIGQTR
jgi:ATP-dependent helicase Lhr and Lhr-like helicase